MFDLDGVIWLGDAPISGASAAVNRLQRAGADTLFVTNMSRLTMAEQEAKLARHGIDATGQVITSAMVAADLVTPGERVMVVGGVGITEALAARGAELVPAAPTSTAVDVVVVGMDPTFDYERLKAATLALRAGARLVATNTDPVYPTTEGLLPGAGAVLAAVVTASDVEPIVAGKPSVALAAAITARLGAGGIVVGDRADTDGLLARLAGYQFGLVLSGSTTEADLPVDPAPDVVAADLAALVEAVW